MNSGTLRKLWPILLFICAISGTTTIAQDEEEESFFEQPAVITRSGHRSGAEALIFPRPHENLPNPEQVPVTGVPNVAGGVGSLAFCAADKVIMAQATVEGGETGSGSIWFSSVVSIVDLASASSVATIPMRDYGGWGTIAAPPSYNVVLASSNTEWYGYRDLSSNVVHVIRPPFNASASVKKTRIPGFIQPYQQNAIAFDPKTERAFIFHNDLAGEGGGISVLDPPYSRVEFTIPCPWWDGDVAITPDGKTLLVTGIHDGQEGVGVYHAPFSPASRRERLPLGTGEYGPYSAFGVAITPDGSTAIVTSNWGYRKAFAIRAPFNAASQVEELPLPPDVQWGGDNFESVDISPDGQLAILAGGDWNDAEPAVFIRAPFTAAGATSYNVAIPGGRANGAVRFRPAGVVFSISVPDSKYKPGDEFLATIKLEYGGSKTMTVRFEEPLLAADDIEILKVEPAELPPPVVLAPGNSNATFRVPVRVNDYGVAELISKATFHETDSEPQLREATREVVVNPLTVSVRALPLVDGKPIINMELDEEGKVTDTDGKPISPKVEVVIENQGRTPVRASLLGVNPRARDRSAVVGRIGVAGTFPVVFELLGPGEKVKREFDMEIHEDGRFEFNASVTGANEAQTADFHVVARGAPIAVGEPYPVELELDFVRTPAITDNNGDGVFKMQAGSKLDVIASVKNLTTNSTLKFYGIKAEKRLNAFGATLTSDDGRLIDPPFAHDHEVDANATAVLSGSVLTEGEGGAPKGTVTWVGPEEMVLVDDETEEETKLDMDDVLVTGNLGSSSDPLSITIVQDYSRDFAPPSLSWPEIGAVWSHGAMVGIGQWMYDSLDAIGGIGRVAGHISADPSGLARAMGEGSRAVWEAAELAAATWEKMSPNERDEFVLSFVDEVQRRAALTVKAPFDPEKREQAAEFTRNAIYSLFSGVEEAYATDDPAKIADMWGRVSGNIAMEVVTAAVPTPKFTKYTKAAEASRLADSNVLGKAMNEQEAFLRAVKSGPVDGETTIKHWGIGGKNLSDIQDLFRRFGIKGYARERGPEAYRLIDELGEAVWKPEAMKPKGISDVDLLLLDNKVPEIRGQNGADLGAEGITAIFMPEADDVLTARLKAQGHSDEMIQVCLSRAQLRREEFEKYVPEFEAWSRPVSEGGGIPVAKNYEDNGVPNPVNDPGTPRSFRFERHAGEGKPTIYIPKMMNADGTAFKYISGDIDWIHFSFLDGTPLDAEMAARLYDGMSRCCGLQHPETISWILNKQTVFKGKINQIGEYMRSGPDQKALLEVSGEGTRAAHVSENLTRFAEDGRNHLVFFDGGLKSRLRATAADVETAFRYFQDRFPDRRLIAPFLWLSKYTEGDTTIDGNEWSFTTSDDAILARQGSNGADVEVFDGTNWIPKMLAELPKPLALTPATGLSASSEAGATKVEIIDLAALWPEEMAGRVASWFTVGQTVIIAPGTPEEETRTIAALGSLIFDQPLTFAHPEGTLVAVLPKALETNPTPTPSPSATPVPTISPLPTATVAPTATATPGTSPSPSATASPTPTATPAPTVAPLQLLNISTRLNVQTGENVLIGGIIITGTEPKKVILRAIGPSLAQAVDGALQDPVLELFDGAGEPVTSNDNWRDTDEFEINASTIPPSHEAESAIVSILAPGNYTAVVSGKDGATGIGLVEVYDLAGSATSQLANISSRGFVETGDNALIGGFIAGGLDGGRPAKVVIRALGPSLTDQGVSGALADPTLELIDANGSTVRANDDWQTGQQSELEAIGIQPAHDAESALIATLPPGNYTAVVRGKNDTTGVGLVEVYNVP